MCGCGCREVRRAGLPRRSAARSRESPAHEERISSGKIHRVRRRTVFRFCSGGLWPPLHPDGGLAAGALSSLRDSGCSTARTPALKRRPTLVASRWDASNYRRPPMTHSGSPPTRTETPLFSLVGARPLTGDGRVWRMGDGGRGRRMGLGSYRGRIRTMFLASVLSIDRVAFVAARVPRAGAGGVPPPVESQLTARDRPRPSFSSSKLLANVYQGRGR